MEKRSDEVDPIVRNDRVTITAIVATYNEEQHIHGLLEGLLAQEGLDDSLEVVVVDGMSTDATRDLIRNFP